MLATTDYIRDGRTGALINNDQSALDKAKKAKKNKINTQRRIESLEKELNTVKKEMTDIRLLLKKQ